jgi:hypothetical protein
VPVVPVAGLKVAAGDQTAGADAELEVEGMAD